MNSSESLTIAWSSTNSVSGCSATSGNFSASGASGSDSTPTRPTAGGADVTYTIDCGNGATDSITVNMSAQPNLGIPVINPSFGTFDMTTGMYNNVSFTVSSPSNGNVAVPGGQGFELDFSGALPTLTGTLSGANAPGTATGNASTPNVMFGTYPVTVTVDQNNNLTEGNEGDNTATYTLTIPIVDPGISLTVDRTQVRNGETATLDWDTVATFPMTCDVLGPGISVPTFDPSTATGPTGNTATAPITAKSEYTLRCVEPVTGTVFTDTKTVESLGEIEER